MLLALGLRWAGVPVDESATLDAGLGWLAGLADTQEWSALQSQWRQVTDEKHIDFQKSLTRVLFGQVIQDDAELKDILTDWSSWWQERTDEKPTWLMDADLQQRCGTLPSELTVQIVANVPDNRNADDSEADDSDFDTESEDPNVAHAQNLSAHAQNLGTLTQALEALEEGACIPQADRATRCDFSAAPVGTLAASICQLQRALPAQQLYPTRGRRAGG
ncbi:hypothetical protein KFU94_00010 [Chloroflexi bacterium TSY]|nr:hypothetical protein [Chloroflexi bacterium TSY]